MIDVCAIWTNTLGWQSVVDERTIRLDEVAEYIAWAHSKGWDVQLDEEDD